MAGSNTIKYFPENLRNEPLYQKVAEMLDYTVDLQDDNLNDILNKYKDFNNISTDAVEEVLKESGYGYIIDMLKVTDTEAVDLVGYLAYIHYLKGHKSGIDLVLKLLGISYTMEEWWEQIPQGTPHTFDLTINVNFTAEDVIATIRKFRLFLQEYVYPKVVLSLVYGNQLAGLESKVGGVPDLIRIADVQQTQIVTNGNFEIWSGGGASPPDDWTLEGAGASVAQDAVNKKFGSYGMALTRAGNDADLVFDISPFSAYEGYELMFGIWLKSSDVNAEIEIDDGTPSSVSHSGSGDFEFITISKFIEVAAPSLELRVKNITGDKTIYADGALAFIIGQ